MIPDESGFQLRLDLGIWRMTDLFRSATVPGAVTAMAQDTAGNLWIANEHVGLFQVLRGSVVQQIPWSRLGRNDHVSAMAADTLRGGIWLGFFLGGVAYYSEGQIRASYTHSRRADRRSCERLPTRSGWDTLDCDRRWDQPVKERTICHVDQQERIAMRWCSLVKGRRRAFILALHALRLVACCTKRAGCLGRRNGPGHKCEANGPCNCFRYFGWSTEPRNGKPFHPASRKINRWQTVVLAGDGGVNLVDPNHLPFNKLPPPVHIEQLIADRKTYDAISDGSGPLRLPPLIRDLQIDYTALSLVAPEKILFRYKLEGRDSDWQEAGNRRQVFYNDLSPGNYRFRVMACNNSGVWNEAGTYVDFTIAPAYYQTAWFRIAVVILLLLVLGALYQLRLRQVARVVRGRMEERLEERERIARDLHDTLLQSVQGLILKFHAVSKQIPADLPAYDALEKTLDHADEVLAEGRDSIRNLRVNSASLSDLPAAFRSVAEETSQGREAIFKTVVEGHVRELHPLVLEECYCIGREAIINALSHSEGQHVEAEIAYDRASFVCAFVTTDEA